MRTCTHCVFLSVCNPVANVTLKSQRKTKQEVNELPAERAFDVLETLIVHYDMLLLFLSSDFPSVLPVTQECTFIYRN